MRDVENNTLISNKEIHFIAKLRMRTLPIIIYKIIIVFFGVFYLMISIANLDVPHPNYSTVLFYFILGVVFIVFAFWGLKFIYYKKSLKSSNVNMPRKMVFKKDKVTVQIESSDLNSTNEFAYSIFADMVIIHDDCYYLKLKDKNQYLIVNISGFKDKNDKEQVIEYLQNNNKSFKVM